MRVIKKDTYRSKPLVNMDDDRVRITLDMTMNEYRELLKKLEEVKK